MIDLSTLQPGDTVILRCGGRIVVNDGVHGEERYGWVTIIIDGVPEEFKLSGAYSAHELHALDIVGIEPKPLPRQIVEYIGFSWKDGCGGAASDPDVLSCSWDKRYRITTTEGQPPKIEEV